MRDEDFMRLAIEACRAGLAAGQAPFGAAIVRDGRPVAVTHNHVWLDTDVTAHAEIHCLRLACRKLGGIDLSGCTIYSTTEPCPMCFAAIHWARIGRIVYGAGIGDAQAAGFNELPISNHDMKQSSGSPVAITGGCLRDECRDLFALWKAQPNHRGY